MPEQKLATKHAHRYETKDMRPAAMENGLRSAVQRVQRLDLAVCVHCGQRVVTIQGRATPTQRARLETFALTG